jgi:hypothetical protein
MQRETPVDAGLDYLPIVCEPRDVAQTLLVGKLGSGLTTKLPARYRERVIHTRGASVHNDQVGGRTTREDG